MTAEQEGGGRRAIKINLNRGEYGPRIASLESSSIREYELHDQLFKKMDPERIQTEYSHCEHSLKVGEFTEGAVHIRGFTDYRIEVGRIAGVLHDKGKLRRYCHIYRAFRRLTPAEKARVDMHPVFSVEDIARWKSLCSPSERKFLDDLIAPVRWHHWPAEVRTTWLREITWDVHFRDLFLALTEDRWRPGLAPHIALEAIPLIVDENRDNRYPAALREEISVALKVLEKQFYMEPQILAEAERRAQEI